MAVLGSVGQDERGKWYVGIKGHCFGENDDDVDVGPICWAALGEIEGKPPTGLPMSCWCMLTLGGGGGVPGL